MFVIQNCKDSKYTDDTVFQMINRNFLTLKEDDIVVYKKHLDTVVKDTLLPLMKRDELFKRIFDKLICAGSYNKGTKYGKPEEFDLNLVVKLPFNSNKIMVEMNPMDYSYVKLQIARNFQDRDFIKYSNVLNTWLNHHNYLNQDRFREWMHSIFLSALSNFPKTSNNGYKISTFNATYSVNYKLCGPAFTLKIRTGKIDISVDIVPALEFIDIPLGNGYRPMIYGDKQVWMVVPKPVSSNVPNNQFLWRLAFQYQEKEFLIGDIKQIIRMMKKFRDSKKWNSIVSYYIETIFYHELAKYRLNPNDLMSYSRTKLFMLGLEKLRQALENQNLAYFWHRNTNLFDTIGTQDLNKFADQLHKIIVAIDKNIKNDPFILADVVLEKHESNSLRKSCGVDVVKQKRSNSTVVNYKKYNNNRKHRKISDDTNILYMFLFVLLMFVLYMGSETSESTS